VPAITPVRDTPAPPVGQLRDRAGLRLHSLKTGLVAAAIAVASGLLLNLTGAANPYGVGVSAASPAHGPRCNAVARPGANVQRFVDSLGPGQTGCFRGGTYTFSQVLVGKRHITLTPFGSARVTLRGDIKVLPQGAGSVIEGVKLDGAGGKRQIGPRIYADNVVLRDNEITNRHTGICVLVSRFYSDPPPRGVVIARNRIHDCGRLPSTNHDHGIYVAEARDTMIRDDWIYDNADRGVQLYPDADRTTVTGNVILANGDGLTINRSSSGNDVYGNIIVDSVLGWNVYSGPDAIGSNNRVHDNCVRGRNRERHFNLNGGIQTPQLHFTGRQNAVAKQTSVFKNRPTRDLRMQWDSSCRGKYTGTLSLPGARKR
jgi:parallel beta helix pectate lyase-like protein